MFNRIGSFFLTSKNISLALENNMFNCVCVCFLLFWIFYTTNRRINSLALRFVSRTHITIKKNRSIDGRKIEIRSEIDSKDSTNRKAEPETNQTRKSHSYHRAHLFNNVVT